jgi:hypothetical protein
VINPFLTRSAASRTDSSSTRAWTFKVVSTLSLCAITLRCKECEEAREAAEQRERMLARRGGSSAFLFDLSN